MTFKEAVRSIFTSRKLPQIIAALVVNLAVMSNRSVIAWTSPSHPFLKANNTIIGEPITDDQEAWLVSCIYLVAFVTSPAYSYVNQKYGRKMAGYLTVLPLAIGWFIISYANSITLLYVGRIVQGFSFGGVNVFQSMYISEVSEDGIRGTLGAMRGVSTELGSLIMYAIGPYLGICKTAIASLVFPALFLLFFPFLPESPMHLLGIGEKQKALDSYIWFRRGDVENAQEEFKKLNVVIQAKPEEMTMRQILFSRDTRNAMVIAIVLNLVMRLCGFLVIFSYISKLFEISGSSVSKNIDPIIVGMVSLCGSIFATCVTDSLGRRVVLITTLMAQGISLGVLGTFICLKELDFDVTDFKLIPLICLSLYCACVIPGIGSTTFVVISEIFRPEARGLATAITCPLSWVLAFVCTQYHHDLEYYFGLHGCYWIYGGVSLFGAIFTYFKVPETKNRSLESILQELNGNEPIQNTNMFKLNGKKLKRTHHEMEDGAKITSIKELSILNSENEYK